MTPLESEQQARNFYVSIVLHSLHDPRLLLHRPISSCSQFNQDVAMGKVPPLVLPGAYSNLTHVKADIETESESDPLHAYWHIQSGERTEKDGIKMGIRTAGEEPRAPFLVCTLLLMAGEKPGSTKQKQMCKISVQWPLFGSLNVCSPLKQNIIRLS